MSVTSCRAILGMGAFFVFLGIAFVLLGRKEKKTYYNSMVDRRDMKEFITREPERPWLNAWQTGGWVSISVGVVLVALYGWFCS